MARPYVPVKRRETSQVLPELVRRVTGLTRPQSEVFTAIINGIQAGTPPTFREIADARGVNVNAIRNAVHSLERHGFVKRQRGIANGFKLTRDAKAVIREVQ